MFCVSFYHRVLICWMGVITDEPIVIRDFETPKHKEFLTKHNIKTDIFVYNVLNKTTKHVMFVYSVIKPVCKFVCFHHG